MLCSDFDVSLLADDSALKLANKNVDTLQNNLDTQQKKVNSLLKNNQLSLKADKTKYLFFTKSNKRIKMKINGTETKQSNKLTILEYS